MRAHRCRQALQAICRKVSRYEEQTPAEKMIKLMVGDLNYFLCPPLDDPKWTRALNPCDALQGSNLRAGKAQWHQIPSSVIAVVANVATVPFLKLGLGCDDTRSNIFRHRGNELYSKVGTGGTSSS